MYIIDPLKENKEALEFQNQITYSDILDKEDLESISQRQIINTNYIHSIFFEKHFIKIINEYMKKTLICGFDY